MTQDMHLLRETMLENKLREINRQFVCRLNLYFKQNKRNFCSKWISIQIQYNILAIYFALNFVTYTSVDLTEVYGP